MFTSMFNWMHWLGYKPYKDLKRLYIIQFLRLQGKGLLCLAIFWLIVCIHWAWNL